MATHPHGFHSEGPSARGTLTRRQLLAAVGGALTLGGGVAALPRAIGAQIDASPPAVAPVVGPGTIAPSVADQAAALNYDVARIFRFVADEIVYAPYSGALRGATGTLWARAGNSVDKALLLGALLDEAQVTHRFAFGPLGDTAVTTLLKASTVEAEPAKKRWAASIDAMLGTPPDGGAPATPVATLTSDQERQIKQQLDDATSLNAEAGRLLNHRVETISEALGTAGVTLPALAPATLPIGELRQHTWVQMADGPAWVDLDPSVAARQGVALAKATSTGDLPDSVHHRVRFSVVVEEVAGGQPQKREVTAFELPSADLVNMPVALLVVPPAAMKGIGNAINQAIGGKSKLVPTYFTARGGSYSDSTIVFGSQGESGLGAFSGTPVPGTPAEGETIAIWSVIDVTGPDRDPAHVERTLLDRVDPAERASGQIDLTRIAPVEFVTGEDGGSTIKQLQSMWIYSVDTAHYPAVLAGTDAISARIFGGMQLMTQAYPTVRAAVGLAHELALGYLADIHTPNLIGVTVALAGSTGSVRSDLLLQEPAIALVRSAPAPPVHPLLAAGVGNQIAEQLLFTRLGEDTGTATPAATSLQVNDASAIFTAVEQSGTAWKALKGGEDASALGLTGSALLRVKTLLDAGLVVVLPERPVASAGGAKWAWWVVDPRTGRTWDQFEDGSGSAGRTLPAAGPLAVEFEEETVVDLIPYAYVDHYRRTALCVAAICGLTAAILGMAGAGIGYAGATTGLGKAGAVLGGVASTAGAAGGGIGTFYACAG